MKYNLNKIIQDANELGLKASIPENKEECGLYFEDGYGHKIKLTEEQVANLYNKVYKEKFIISEENESELIWGIDEALQRNGFNKYVSIKIDEDDVEIKVDELEINVSIDDFENEVELDNYVVKCAIRYWEWH